MDKNIAMMKDLMSFQDCVYLMNPREYADAPVNSVGITDFNPDGKMPWGMRYKISDQEFGILAGKSLNPFIYRGENKEYKRFTPSSQRGSYTILDMKIKDMFKELYRDTLYYKFANSCKDSFGYSMQVDFEAIAQHYGFKTNYVDITRIRDVAEFFAYTYYDHGTYYPITDFSEYCPCLYTADLHDFYREKLNSIKLISGQIALRPCSQRAMAIDNFDGYDCKSLFKKEILPKDKKIAEEIYERNYNLLFPEGDILKEIADMLLSVIVDYELEELLHDCKSYLNEFSNIRKMDRDIEWFAEKLKATKYRAVSIPR